MCVVCAMFKSKSCPSKWWMMPVCSTLQPLYFYFHSRELCLWQRTRLFALRRAGMGLNPIYSVAPAFPGVQHSKVDIVTWFPQKFVFRNTMQLVVLIYSMLHIFPKKANDFFRKKITVSQKRFFNWIIMFLDFIRSVVFETPGLGYSWWHFLIALGLSQ